MSAARTTTAAAVPDTATSSPVTAIPDTALAHSARDRNRPDTAQIKLSTGQLNLLRFFAGHTLTPPRAIHTSTYNTLIAHGLIEWHTQRARYQVTQYGKHVAARLYPADPPPHPPR